MDRTAGDPLVLAQALLASARTRRSRDMDSRFRGNDQSGRDTRICQDAAGSCAIREPDGRGAPHGAYAASMAFSRCSHSSSSTISKRMILPRMAGANSAQSCCFACREQRSNTERL